MAHKRVNNAEGGTSETGTLRLHGVELHAGLSADETIVELYIERAELQCEAGANFATFCELDFFQHATQATPVVQGSRFVLTPSLPPSVHDCSIRAALSGAQSHAYQQQMIQYMRRSANVHYVRTTYCMLS